jgi:ABC-type sugar transport system permease subunit
MTPLRLPLAPVTCGGPLAPLFPDLVDGSTATAHPRGAARLMISPAVLLLLGWMLIPLSMTIWFSFHRYNLLMPGMEHFTGFDNYEYFLTDPALF